MKEETKGKLICIGIIIAAVAFISFLIYGLYFHILQISMQRSITIDEYKTLEGEITNVVIILDDDGSIDYLIITFDNKEQIKAYAKSDTDLTVHSKLIIQFHKYADESDSDIWHIGKILKVPDGGDSP